MRIGRDVLPQMDFTTNYWNIVIQWQKEKESRESITTEGKLDTINCNRLIII
jgi:hypothetical protein